VQTHLETRGQTSRKQTKKLFSTTCTTIKDVRGKVSSLRYLKKKIGPKKSGYLGSCTFGGGITVMYEKKLVGVQRLLEMEVDMNGNVNFQKKVSKGYYDVYSHDHPQSGWLEESP